MHISEFVAHLSRPELPGTVDVMELFGGDGGVGKLCSRRRPRRGENVDLVIGYDLTNEEHASNVMLAFGVETPVLPTLDMW